MLPLNLFKKKVFAFILMPLLQSAWIKKNAFFLIFFLGTLLKSVYTWICMLYLIIIYGKYEQFKQS